MTDESAKIPSGTGDAPGVDAPDVENANAVIAATPLPTGREIAQRSSLLRQAVRFVVLNLKILKLSRQHH